jgi:hypothetical protein
MVLHGRGPGLIPKEAPVKFEADKPVGECQSIRVLKSNPQPKTGMELLTKIASLVAPIMRRHQWQLPELLEFFPDNPNLLGMNVNRGRKILIRLRPQHAPDTFLDLEGQLIGTMLHELSVLCRCDCLAELKIAATVRTTSMAPTTKSSTASSTSCRTSTTSCARRATPAKAF